MLEKRKQPFYKQWWFVVMVAMLLIIIFTNVSNDAKATKDDIQIGDKNVEEANHIHITNGTGNDAEKNRDDIQLKIAETGEDDRINHDYASFGAGLYFVNEEIEPGLYYTDGGIMYWERLSGLSKEIDDIIANGLPNGRAYVEILKSDVAFSSKGTGIWVKWEEDKKRKPLTEFGDGQYIVGIDIEPGKYINDEVTADFGYWARLKGFTGELKEIIENDNIKKSVIVEISPNDVGFETSGCGTWKKID